MNNRTPATGLTALLSFAVAGFAVAGVPHAARAQPVTYVANETNDFQRRLYSPELIMKNHREISLSAEQRATITQAIQALQSAVVDPQWRLMESSQVLSDALEAATVVQADALAAIDQMLDAEREIKRAHLTALIRIKNALTASQREQLDELRGHRATVWGQDGNPLIQFPRTGVGRW